MKQQLADLKESQAQQAEARLVIPMHYRVAESQYNVNYV